MSAASASRLRLDEMPAEVIIYMFTALASVLDVASVYATCRGWHAPKIKEGMSLVEQALRVRAKRSGHTVPARLPAGESSWIELLCWLELRNTNGGRLKILSAGEHYSAFIVKNMAEPSSSTDAGAGSSLAHDGGTLLMCGSDDSGFPPDHGRHGVTGFGTTRVVERPSPVPTLMGTPMVSVSVSYFHTLAMAAGGAFFSFGVGLMGALGHGDYESRHEPTVVAALLDTGIWTCHAGQYVSMAVHMSFALGHDVSPCAAKYDWSHCTLMSNRVLFARCRSRRMAPPCAGEATSRADSA